jgi:hypothetical protein
LLAYAFDPQDTAMAEVSPHLRRVMSRAIAEARAAGLDYEAQTRRAAQMVMELRPHLTGPEALQLARRVREQDTGT